MKWSDFSISKVLDYLINKLPIIDWFNGHKTELAGVIAGIAGVFIGASTLLPQYSEALVKVADLLFKLAGTIGTVGVAGKLAKFGLAKSEANKLAAAPKLSC